YRIVPRNVDTNFIGADQLQAEMGVALECRGNRQEARCRRRVDAHALDGLAGEQEIEAVDRIRARRADSTAEAVGEARSAWQQIGDDDLGVIDRDERAIKRSLLKADRRRQGCRVAGRSTDGEFTLGTGQYAVVVK